MRYLNSTRIRGKKGYTLLFAVIVSTVVLSIAAFILSISRKQFILASAARDSINAFYAADSGIECAIFMSSDSDLLSTSTIYNNPSGAYKCNNISVNFKTSDDGNDPTLKSTDHATTTFYMRMGDTNACAWVKMGYDVSPTKEVTYIIESRGYNIGWDNANSDCRVTGPRKVERALRLIYR